jgi:hypothetical protein
MLPWLCFPCQVGTAHTYVVAGHSITPSASAYSAYSTQNVSMHLCGDVGLATLTFLVAAGHSVTTDGHGLLQDTQ